MKKNFLIFLLSISINLGFNKAYCNFLITTNEKLTSNVNFSDSLINDGKIVYQELVNNLSLYPNAVNSLFNFSKTNELKKIHVPKFYFNKSSINYTRLALVGSATLSTALIVHYYQKNAWWKDQRKSFHLMNDWNYALWNDKIAICGVQRHFNIFFRRR